ncbi:MAG: hypothetical protein AAF249_12835 [Pseudomonadota bacterium]
MRNALLISLSSLLALPVSAQVYPTLSPETPRLQSVVAKPDTRIVLTALPKTALTVMLGRGQMINRIVLEPNRLIESHARSAASVVER